MKISRMQIFDTSLLAAGALISYFDSHRSSDICGFFAEENLTGFERLITQETISENGYYEEEIVDKTVEFYYSVPVKKH